MLEEARRVAPLEAIKHHLDSHGVGSAIMNDHVAIGLGGGGSPGAFEKIVRVRSLDEARCLVGCCCMKAE